MSRKTVITCALTGSFDTASKNPAVPVSPQAIAQSALEAAAAGAAIVHIHVRDPATGKPSMELSLYREVVERIREKNADVVLNLTTGAGGRYVAGDPDPAVAGPGTTLASPEARTRHVTALKPEICTLDVATMNFGEHAFMNTPAHLRAMAALIREAGAKPEIEVFDLGQIELARHLLAEGHLDSPPMFQICLGIPWGRDVVGLRHLAGRVPDGGARRHRRRPRPGRARGQPLPVARAARTEQRGPRREGGEPARPSRLHPRQPGRGTDDLRALVLIR
jgi:uncharacterized protein (DUF849 family)